MLTLAGCAALGQGPGTDWYGRVDAPSVDALHQVLEEQRAAVQSLRGIAKVRVTFDPLEGEAPKSFSTSQAVLAQAPASFRLDTLSTFGVSYAAMSDGETITVLAPDQGTIYRGPAIPATVSSATGVSAAPGDITLTLLGRPPLAEIEKRQAWVSAGHDGGKAETSPGGRGAEVYLHAPTARGETILVGFARAPVGNGAIVPVSFERISPKGIVLLRARFGAHRDVNGQILAEQVEVAAPGSKVTLEYRELEANPPLESSNFLLATPAGMRDLPLGPP